VPSHLHSTSHRHDTGGGGGKGGVEGGSKSSIDYKAREVSQTVKAGMKKEAKKPSAHMSG
jgi:hypothetical protein